MDKRGPTEAEKLNADMPEPGNPSGAADVAAAVAAIQAEPDDAKTLELERALLVETDKGQDPAETA